MKVLFGLRGLEKITRAVVTLGVFDGLHRAHRNIISHAVSTARRVNGRSIVVTFYPHPQGQKSLYSLKHRIRLFQELGVDICVVIKFTKSFSQISASQFIENVIIMKLHPYCIFIGENFTFGRGALGNAALLEKYARLYNFKLKIFPVAKSGLKIISSTYIRSLIADGKLNAAYKLLGSRVSIFGRVIAGKGLGASLGFPTANINPHHEVVPPFGVYAVKVKLKNRLLNGACYIGTKPTLKSQSYKVTKSQDNLHIEVHILDFKKDIYGQDLEVQFIKKIRGEKAFTSKELLKKQIQKALFIARRILHHNISVF